MNKEFEKLRELIVQKEIDQLDDIILRVKNIENSQKRDILVKSLSKIIVEILVENINNDENKIYSVVHPFVIKGLKEELNGTNDEISKILGPLISSSIKEQVHKEKDSIVDALYPIMGNMVSKYVTNAFKNMMVEINYKLQDTLSTEIIQRKIKSKIYKISEAELLIKESNFAKVNSIFLIHKESGMLILDAHREDNKKIDEPEMVASMLSAIKSFVNDWISNQDKMSEVSEIEYGNSSILIESAGSVYLAVVIDGKSDFNLQEEISFTLSKVILNHAIEISEYDGDPETIKSNDIIKILSTLFYNKSKNKNKNKLENKFPIFSTILLIFFILTPLSWSGFNSYKEYLIKKAEDSIISLIQKNNIKIYDFKIQTDNKIIEIEGIVLNQNEKDKLNILMLNTNVVNSVDCVNYSFLNQYIKLQLNKILFDYNNKYGSNISYIINNDNKIILKGSIIDINAKNELANYLNKIFKDYKLEFNIKLLPKFKDRIYFEVSSFEISEKYNIILDNIYKLLKIHNSYKIRITGYTDIQGDTLFNKNLSFKRANSVKTELIKRGINKKSIIISFVAAPPNDILDTLTQKNISRCVAFNWEINSSE